MSSDHAHGLCTQIGRVVKAAAPDGWQHVYVDRAQLGTFSTTAIAYQMADGSRQTRQVDGLDDLFQQLKTALYEPGKGTWFLCRLDYGPRGKSYNSVEHTFSVESPFGRDVEVPASAYVEELTMFPRRPDLTPPWMTATWPEGAAPPEARPAPPVPMDEGTTRPGLALATWWRERSAAMTIQN